jgi:hypothetical protein
LAKKKFFFSFFFFFFFFSNAGLQIALPMFIFSRTVNYDRNVLGLVFALFFFPSSKHVGARCNIFSVCLLALRAQLRFGLQVKWSLVQSKLN